MLKVVKSTKINVYPSQAINSSSSNVVLNFKLPNTGHLFSPQSTIHIQLQATSGLAPPNLQGLNNMVSSVQLSVGGTQILNTNNIGPYLCNNLRSNVDVSRYHDVCKFESGINNSKELRQVVAADFKSITSSLINSVIDTNLMVKTNYQTPDCFEYSVKLSEISNFFRTPLPIYLLGNNDINLTLTLDMTLTGSTLALSSGGASALTVQNAYIFAVSYTMSDVNLLDKKYSVKYNDVLMSGFSLAGETSKTVNLGLNNQKLKRMMLLCKADTNNTVFGAANSNWANSHVVPSLQLFYNNVQFFNKPVLLDGQIVQYTNECCKDIFVNDFGAQSTVDGNVVMSATVDGSSANYKTAGQGSNNVVLLNFKKMVGSGDNFDDFTFIGSQPVQIQLQTTTTLPSSCSLVVYSEVEKQALFLDNQIMVI